jgi:hypothetical protein
MSASMMRSRGLAAAVSLFPSDFARLAMALFL